MIKLIYIYCPTAREKLEVDRALEKTTLPFPVKTFKIGVGARSAKAVEKSLEKSPDYAVITGVCGALHPDIKRGQTIISASLLKYPEGKIVPCGEQKTTNEVLTGILVTSDIVCKAQEKSEIHAAYPEALAVVMEDWHCAAVLKNSGIPWMCLRTVSDTFYDKFPDNMVFKLSRKKRLRCLLNRPRELFRYTKTMYNFNKSARINAHTVTDLLATLFIYR